MIGQNTLVLLSAIGLSLSEPYHSFVSVPSTCAFIYNIKYKRQTTEERMESSVKYVNAFARAL